MARNTNLAHRLAIDLPGDLTRAKFLVSLDPDLPLFGGRTLKVTAGLEVRYVRRAPGRYFERGECLGSASSQCMAWRYEEHRPDEGIWDRPGLLAGLAERVEKIEVEQGKLRIQLKE